MSETRSVDRCLQYRLAADQTAFACNLDDQDAALGGQCDQQHQADLCTKVIGKTTTQDAEQARRLLNSITSTMVGLRDTALISVMTFDFARVGAVVAMRVEDLLREGER